MRALLAVLTCFGLLGCGNAQKPLPRADSAEPQYDSVGQPSGMLIGGEAALAMTHAPAAVMKATTAKPDLHQDAISGTCRQEAGAEQACEGLYARIQEGARTLMNLPLQDASFMASGLRPGIYKVVLINSQGKPIAETSVHTGQSIQISLKKVNP